MTTHVSPLLSTLDEPPTWSHDAPSRFAFSRVGEEHLPVDLVEYLRDLKHLRHIILEGDGWSFFLFEEALGVENRVQESRGDGSEVGAIMRI